MLLRMDIEDRELLDRTYRLAKENNEMLRSMRRAAFFSGLFRMAVWIALVGVPLWFYIQYLHPTLSSAIDTLNKVQGSMNDASARVNAPVSDFTQMLEGLKGYLPGGEE